MLFVRAPYTEDHAFGNKSVKSFDISTLFGLFGTKQNAASVNFAPKFVILCKILMLLLYKRLCKTSPHSTKSLDLYSFLGILKSDRKTETVKIGLQNAILCKFYDEKRSALNVRTDLLNVFANDLLFDYSCASFSVDVSSLTAVSTSSIVASSTGGTFSSVVTCVFLITNQ